MNELLELRNKVKTLDLKGNNNTNMFGGANMSNK